jgi:hypothetical protein
LGWRSCGSGIDGHIVLFDRKRYSHFFDLRNTSQ